MQRFNVGNEVVGCIEKKRVVSTNEIKNLHLLVVATCRKAALRACIFIKMRGPVFFPVSRGRNAMRRCVTLSC